MNDKCFCHLNGFAVKDATARNEIENIKTNYATKEHVASSINSIPSVNLDSYATKEYVETSINNIPDVNLEPYATKEYVNNSIVRPVILYNNVAGTTETITLSSSISNFDYLEIYYTHKTCNHCQKAISVDSSIGLDSKTIMGDDDIEYCQNAQITISGTTVTWVYNREIKHNTTGSDDMSGDAIKIVRIVGYKY